MFASLAVHVRGGGLWLLVWCCAAVLHVSQAVWVSGGAAYPGDLGDARFNNLVLEHGYLSLRGVYEWSSPGQFHPATDTLGFSDTHAGTLPLYAAARFAGLTVERSWQCWFLVVAAANALAVVRLLAALRVPRLAAGPLVFLACAPPTMVWYAGSHAQILAMFPALFGLEQCVRLALDGRLVRVLSIAGLFCWQFAASPYLAVLAVLVVGIGAVLWLVLALAQPTIRPALCWQATLGRWLAAAALALLGGAGALVSVIVYRMTIARWGGGGSMEDLLLLSPDWRSWFSSPAGHWLYPPSWPAGNPNQIEGCLFFGFVPWLAGGWGLVHGLRRRQLPDAAVALCCGGAAGIGALFFTRWGAGANGGYIQLAEWAAPFRAFRASGRVVALLPVLLAVPLGVLLRSWLGERGRRWRVAVSVVLLVAVGEAITVHQPAVRVAEVRDRAESLLTAWQAAGDRPVLLFAPGFSNQGSDLPQLDAWDAAMRARRHCVNGFSGHHTAEFDQFVSEPTTENGRALLARLGISPERVSVVDRWPAATAERWGIVRFGECPERPLDGLGLQPSRWRVFHTMEAREVGGILAYKFLPPAEVHFPLPDSAARVGFHAGLCPGTFEETGRSDGFGFECRIGNEAGDEVVVAKEFVDARDERLRQGLRRFELVLPEGRSRVLVLRVDPGPSGQGAWDFPLFGRIEAHP